MVESKQTRKPLPGREALGFGYRLVGQGEYVKGQGVEITGAELVFFGSLSLEVGRAAEARLVPENRLTPPLVAYFEVDRCEKRADGHYHIVGKIQGIKSAQAGEA